MMPNQQKETKQNYKDVVVNPSSERALISICLQSPDKIVDIEHEEVDYEHFGVDGHKYIYMAIQYLFSKQIDPTPFSVMEVLVDEKAKKSIEELGGLEYLLTLEEAYIKDSNIKIFCMKVKQAYTRREILKLCDDVKEEMMSNKAETLNPSELSSILTNKSNDITANIETTGEVYKMGDDTDEVLEERAESPETVPGLEIGWTKYDKYTNGAQPGDLVIICAESKTGKSVMLTNWAKKLAIIDKIPVLYFDTEMSAREQEDRLLAMLSEIPHSEIVSGMYVIDTENGTSEDKMKRLKVAKQQLKESNYYHIYMPQFNLEQVTAITRKFQLQHDVGAMFFDYIKIPSNANSSKTTQEYQELGFFTSGLKDIAGMLQMPVFTACQTNRSDLGNTEKDATSIGGSYRILQLATKLMFLTNKSEEQIAKQGVANGNQILSIKYQRNGESDCPPLNINFRKNIIKMDEV